MSQIINQTEKRTDEQVVVERVVIKPGLKTTEFWVSVIAAVLPPVMAAFFTEEQVAQVVGIVSPILAALGYNISRGLAKF